MSHDPPSSPDPQILSYGNIVTPPFWARLLMRPLGWPFFILAIAAVLWIFWQSRLPGVSGWLECFYLGVPLILLWWLRFVLRMVLWRIYRRPWPQLWRESIRFGLALWIPILVPIFLLTHVPERVALRFSQPALQRLVDAALASPTPPPTPTTAGCYTIYNIQRHGLHDNIVHLYISTGFSRADGYAYAATPPDSTDEFFSYCHYEHVQGPWYRITPFRWPY